MKKIYKLTRNGRSLPETFPTKEDAQAYADYLNQYYKLSETTGYKVK